MTEFSDFRRRYAAERSTVERLRTYLLTRRSESWLFFFAGIVVGAILG
ncbi:hypothetical protein [Azospirillum thermophilum]|nr:hypothetical protein [Azospirillum thermophilum]